MKIPKQAYTTEFKELAVKRVKDGHTCVARSLTVAAMLICSSS